MNNNDLKLALALLEKDCPEGAPAGKVPLLDPALVREPCAWGIGEESYDHKLCAKNPYRNKETVCEGRSWLPSDDVMDWVRALNKAGYAVTFIHDGRAQVDNLTDLHFIWGQGATLFEAAAQALGVTDKETP